MSSIVVAGDVSGSVTLSAPSAAGSVTVTLPASSGTMLTSASTTMPAGSVNQAALATNVAGTGPAFRGYATTTQSFSASTWTKVTLSGESFDTNSNFASSRFTPTVAGYYQINGKVGCQPSTGTVTRVLCGIFKNGVEERLGSDIFSTGNIVQTSATIATLIYMNGSTDYIELYVYMVGGSPAIEGNSAHTYFEGSLARGA